jgi:hypothetical protein
MIIILKCDEGPSIPSKFRFDNFFYALFLYLLGKYVFIQILAIYQMQ